MMRRKFLLSVTFCYREVFVITALKVKLSVKSAFIRIETLGLGDGGHFTRNHQILSNYAIC